MDTLSLVLMRSCMLGGVSYSASVNIVCMASVVFRSYFSVLLTREMRSTVFASCCVHDGDTWTKRSVVFVVEVVFLCLPFQNALVLIWMMPSGIDTALASPLIMSSLEMMSSGAGLYVMCVPMASRRRASLLMLIVWASHTQ